MAARTQLFGREDDLRRVEDHLTEGAIVTIVGPGGVGKTRLVEELTDRLEHGRGESVPVARLAGLAAGATAEAVVDALGFESVDGAAVQLASRPTALVLDNCEHVVSGVSELLGVLTAAAPDVTVLATSREPLGLPGERVVPLGPLALGGPGGVDAGDSPAVQLFLERAEAAGAVLSPSPMLSADVAELCQRLDGLPLAIRLAAARVRAMSPRDLIDLLDERLDVLHQTRHEADERHDSMRAAIEVSTAALSIDERTFLRRLAVFTGPFDLALAHAAAGEPGSDRLRSIDLLTGLVDRSLVVADVDRAVARYRLLELLRTHALDLLRQADEVALAEERLVEAMVTVADEIVADALSGFSPDVLAAASNQFANLARSVEVCLDRDATPDRARRLVLPMYAAVHEGRPAEVWALGQRVEARWPEHPGPWDAEVRAVLATAAALAGRDDDAVAAAAAVVASPESSGIAVALAERAAGIGARRRDASAAASHFGHAAQAAAAVGFTSVAREARIFEAGQLDLAGQPAEATARLEAVLAEAVDDLFVQVAGRLVGARLLLRLGAPEAGAAIDAAEVASAAIGHPWWTAAILRTRAAAVALGPDGWAASASRWRAAVDFAASRGAMGEMGISLRSAAAVAEHLGLHAEADVLQSAVPGWSAVTVLPELFPEAAAAVEARVGAVPPTGVTLIDALGRARAALDAAGRAEARPAPSGNVLRRDGDVWLVAFQGRTSRVRDLKGIGVLAALLAAPDVEHHALALMGGADVGGPAGPVLDDQARRSYQERIGELQREIDEATDDHDRGRAERAELELDALVGQLTEAFGLGGRARSTGSAAERARTAVTYRIRSGIRRLGEADEALGRHLDHAVTTGTWCAYRPEHPTAWAVEHP